MSGVREQAARAVACWARQMGAGSVRAVAVVPWHSVRRAKRAEPLMACAVTIARRAQQRAEWLKARGLTQYMPKGNPEAFSVAIKGARQIDPTEKRERTEILRRAVDTIGAGRGDAGQWQRVFAVVNMLAAIGDLPGGPLKKADAFISDVQDMVADVMDRIRETRSQTLYPEEITTLRSLETLWAEVLDVISCRELFQASERVSASYRRACAGQPPAGTHVVKGAWA